MPNLAAKRRNFRRRGHDDLAAQRPFQLIATWPNRDREPHREPTISRPHVTLPATRQDGVAVPHQPAVTRVVCSLWSVGADPVVEILQEPDVAAVADVEDQASISFTHIRGSDEADIRAEVYQPIFS